MDFDQKLLLLQSQLSRRYVYTASVTSGETSSLATGLPAKPQETITRIQFNIYINQSNFLGSLQNQARGSSRKISDRWDLTLECIRRYYHGESNPLDSVFEKDAPFFDLFVDFKGYVDFFFFQDCVDDNYNVKFWLDTPLWDTYPMPKTLEEYHFWMKQEQDFLEKRAKRIADYCKQA